MRRDPSFVIMTHPRTGSELLSQSLNLHPDLKVLGEPLNPNRGELSLASESVPYFGPMMVMRYVQSEELKASFESMMSASNGMKIVYEHITASSPVTGWLAGNKGVKVIFMRRNPAHSAMSYWFARKSNVWQNRHRDEPDVVDPDFVEDFCEASMRDHALYSRVFRDHETFDMTYEGMVSDWSGSVGRVLGFIGAETVDLPKYTTKRTDKLDKIVVNYEECMCRAKKYLARSILFG